MSAATLDTTEARARSAKRFLATRKGVHTEQRFLDAEGLLHEIRSCPVPGGRYLYDASEAWGLRALGNCRDDLPAHLEALSNDYAERCAEEAAPVCRALRLSDVKRRRGSGEDGEE
ncbi:MAG TPA: hypothetical protein VII45_03890 [Solirubrobacterales bacterium]